MSICEITWSYSRNGDGRQLRLLAIAIFGLASWFGFGVAMAAGSQVAGVDGEFAALIARCAPTVHPETMSAVISAESHGHQYAIADAGPVKMPWAQRKLLVRSYYMGSLDSAVDKASELISDGHTVSLGLAQVNDRNLTKLGLSIRDVFEPCTNLSAGGQILTEFYKKSSTKFGPGARALRAAISAYNSGDWLRGENEGYVGLVFKQVGRPLSMQSKAVLPSAPHSASVMLRPVWLRGGGQKVKKVGSEREFAMSTREFVVAE